MRLSKFLQEAQPNRDQLRLVAQALAGPALKGGELADVSPTAELCGPGEADGQLAERGRGRGNDLSRTR